MKKRFSLFVMVLVCLALVAGTVLACNAKFVLNFNVDGEIYHQIRTDGEEEIALPENPVKDGWIFDGWYWDNGIWAEPFTAQSLLNVPLESDMTVFAKWINADITQRDFNVVFDSMGGSAVSAAVVRYDNLLTRPNAPTRDGYIFVGWYRDAAFETQWNFSADTVTDNITLYARWVPSTDAAGADIIASGGMTMTGDSLYIELPNATTVFPFSAHITVSPWAQYSVSTDIAGANVIPSATVEIEPGDNVFYIQTVSGNGSNRRQYTATVRRHEMYTVTYDFGHGAEAESVVVEEDSLTEDKAAPLTGYTFDGWYFGEDKWDFSAPVTSDMTLTARYTPNVYTVSFDSAGGGAVESAQVTFDSAFEFIVPERTGYEFLYWSYEDAALTDAAGASVGVYSVADDITVTAVWETVKYSVVYHDVDGASNLNPAVYDIESATFALTAPVKRGYDFVGWFADEQKETAADTTIETGSVGNLEFWAKWSATEYSLEFVLGNGEYASEQNPSVYTIEDEFTFISPVPTVAGYTFDSWRLGSASGAEYTGITAGTTGDMTFYAAYTPIIYDIAYAGVYNGTHSNPATYTVESATITLSAATRTGYTFDGWYAGDDLVTEIATGSYGDKTFTAQWTPITYEIVYENTKGAANANVTEYTIESETIALSDIAATGYTFDGWYEGEELVTEISTGSYGDKTFTAQWTPITYEIVYENTKGAANSNITEYTIESDTITLSDIAATGYTFDGWYEGEELVTEIATGSYGDKTFTAKWTVITYDIVYENTKGAANANVTEYTIESETIALSDIAATGYTFDGWYVGDELVTEIAAGSYGDKTFTAQWTPITYEIVYENTKGAANSNITEYTIESETIALSDIAATGYTFDGWYAGEDLVTEISTGSYGDKTFTAQWTPITYEIVYENTKGAANANITEYTIESETIALSDIAATGYTFDGWYAGEDLVTEIAACSYGDKTFTAKWTPITYEIVYENTKGAANANVTEYTIESETITLSDIAATGYTFDGWYAGEELVTEIATGSYGDKTFTAQWTTLEYELKLVLENEQGGYDGHYEGAANPTSYTIEDDFDFIEPVSDIRGYEFKGWFTEKTGGNRVTGITSGSTGARTYYAQWQRSEYTITYIGVEGAQNSNPATYNVDSATFSLNAPTKIGYIFAGWYSDESMQIAADTTVENNSIGNLTFYAKWALEEYTITYVLYDGTNAAGNPDKYTIEQAVSFEAPTRSGYTFGGWYRDASFNTIITGISLGSTGNITVYAEWHYIGTITFDSNGGSAVESFTAPYNTVISVPEDPVRDHYKFDGWYSDETLQNRYSFGLMPAEDFTLYAKWTPVSYDINYVLNGGVAAAGTVYSYNIESETFALKEPLKTGYSFVGWFLNEEFTSEVVTEVVKGSHGDITVYAAYSINKYTISFESNGGTTVDPLTQNYATTVTAPQAPSKTGYTFGGWYRNAALTQAYSFTTMPAENITLYAKWNVVSYSIVYNLDGGTNPAGNPARYTIESSAITFLSPTKRGYTFDGWYSDSAFNTPVTGISAGSWGEVSVFAKWIINEYDIVYVGADGATNPNPTEYTIEDYVVFEDLYKYGYTFGGLFSDGGHTSGVTEISQGSIGNVTLYAVFTANTHEVWMDGKESANYTVSFDLNGGTGSISPVTVTPTVGLDYPQVPSRSGYIFAGWYANEGCNGLPYDFTAEISSDITLYAKWHEASGDTIDVGSSVSVNISGTSIRDYYFVPLTSGNVTITATGGVDTIGFLYNSEGELLRANDDGAADGLNFLIVYNVTAGELYKISFRGYGSAENGSVELLLSGATGVADGGVTATTGGMKEITFGTHFTLDVPAPREGFVFRGWADAEGVMYTDETGKSVRVFDKDEETVLYSVWEADGFTVTFVTNSGSFIEPVTIPYGDRLDLNQYVTTRSGYSFVGWFISMSDEEAYNATTMPDHDITLYARWTTYNISPIKYDPDLKAVSSLRDISAADFGATCFDTDGNMLDITAMVVSGVQEAGNTVTVRLTATNNNKTQSAMISGVLVYGSPVIAVGEAPDYFNISDGLSAEWFDVTATDTFGTYLGVTAEIAGDYSAGDVVTVVFTVTDAAGNLSTDSIGNIKVYGAPVITADEDVPGIKDTDTLSAALFGAAAEDSFAESVSVSVSISSGSLTAGTTIGVTFTAVDGKGNENTLTLTYKVYGTPAISEPETTEFRVEDVITPEALGMTAEDSFGEALEISLSTEDTQTEGAVMSYTATVTDVTGYVSMLQFTVKIYGTPDISYDREILKFTEDPVPNGAAILAAAACDSFGAPLDITVSLAEGTFAGGEEVRYTLTASDHLGNEVSLTTDIIRVYDLADISLTFDAWSATNIKLTSTGEEFSASATDSFGEACDITLERADGGDLVAGEEQSVVIVATDAAGNECRSEAISGIKVFDMPVINYLREYLYVLDDENAEYLFTATDSFGSNINATANITAESAAELTLSVSATDAAGNTTTEIFVLDKVGAEQSYFLIMLDGEIVDGKAVNIGQRFTLPVLVEGFANVYKLDDVAITDEFGAALTEWEGVASTVYTVTVEPVPFTVEYVLNGGTNAAGNPSEYTGTDGTITLSAPTKIEDISYTSNSDGTFDVTREVYTFEGWYTNSDFTGEAVTELTIDMGNVTLYAKWGGTSETTTENYVRLDASGAPVDTGEYILFGSYPQTEVTDSTITTALNGMRGTLPTSSNSYDWTSYGYYISGDVTNFMWYIDLEYSGEKYRGVYFTSYRPLSTTRSSSTSNSYQDDNGYSTRTVYWFRYEPIKWRILTESDGKAMILSELMLDSQQYDYDGSSLNNYADSTIRAWLNDTFYNTAFGELQQAIIETTEVDNSVYSTGYSSNQYACENTFDKVFLLSYREVVNSSYGFSTSSSSSSTRQKQGSDYCKAQGSYTYSNGNGYWWLRSPYYYGSNFAGFVHLDGLLASSNVNGTNDGVVPALWISL